MVHGTNKLAKRAASLAAAVCRATGATQNDSSTVEKQMWLDVVTSPKVCVVNRAAEPSRFIAKHIAWPSLRPPYPR